MQRRLPQIEALGATLLAISPEKAEHSAQVAERRHLGYDILADNNAHGDPRLLIPARYVIAADARIVAAHVTADWTRHMDPDAIIEHLRALRSG